MTCLAFRFYTNKVVLLWIIGVYLDEVDVVLGAGQLRDLVVAALQVGDLVGQPVHVTLCVVERRPLVGRDQLGHLLLHLLDGAQHVAEELLALLHCLLGRALDNEEEEEEGDT